VAVVVVTSAAPLRHRVKEAAKAINVPFQQWLEGLKRERTAAAALPESRPIPERELLVPEDELFSNARPYTPPPPLKPIDWNDDIPPTPERMADFVKDALAHERVKLYYQPIVDLATGKPLMFETLLRLTDGKNRLVQPPEFLPVAKQFGMLQDIDDTVLMASIHKHTQLQMHGKLLTLSINLSETAFRNENFMKQFTDGVKARRIIPAYLVFEVSSDALLKDDRAMRFVRDMQYMGCRFAIDYFGGGTRAVDAVRSLGFDYMKINALRFADIDSNPESLKIFHDVITAARASKLEVIVEKVETQLMYRLCERLGVPYVQGFFIAPPGPKFQIN
jgi:EAL domain-containing protein (putative c-di-GMP-specific phosphodiesterase class I)